MTGVRRHTVRWLAAGVLAVTAAIVAVLATRPPALATEVDTPLLGRAAPAVSGATLDGRSFDLESLRGRWVVLNFFASWCPPCQQEEPQLVSFAFHHRGPGEPALVGVVYDDSASGARGFLAQSGASWPTVTDPSGQVAIDYGVRGPPETFLISPGGQVVVHLDGAVTEQGLDTWLARAERGEV